MHCLCSEAHVFEDNFSLLLGDCIEPAILSLQKEGQCAAAFESVPKIWYIEQEPFSPGQHCPKADD